MALAIVANCHARIDDAPRYRALPVVMARIAGHR
jgi:hypothetical protein